MFCHGNPIFSQNRRNQQRHLNHCEPCTWTDPCTCGKRDKGIAQTGFAVFGIVTFWIKSIGIIPQPFVSMAMGLAPLVILLARCGRETARGMWLHAPSSAQGDIGARPLEKRRAAEAFSTGPRYPNHACAPLLHGASAPLDFLPKDRATKQAQMRLFHDLQGKKIAT